MSGDLSATPKTQEEHISKKYGSYQEFLDNHQYSREGILSYEKVFGRTFVSTGGEKTTKEFCSLLDLKEGQRVLDICSGIGGSSFYMAKTFGVEVIGVDLSTNMLSIARERQLELGVTGVTFKHADITQTDFEENSFDVVYTRDGMMHIEDKLALFTKVLKWLKPGGKFLVSDYCAPPKDRVWSEDFRAYVNQRGYYLLSVEAYDEVLKKVGFVNVQSWDKKERLVEALKDELDKVKDAKEDFLKDGLSEESFQDIIDGWTVKIGRAENGEHVWGVFLSEKPTSA